MEINFWQERWQKNQIAFHLPEINPYIKAYWSHFTIQNNGQVFVPLCGKSLDLAWFSSQQYSVLGIECSEKAIKEFFNENYLEVQITTSNNFTLYNNGRINLLQGDFFKLNKEYLKDVSIVYDRASLIALPASMRQKYVSLLNKNLPLNSEIFLITLDYNQPDMSGPPFSVNHDEVLNLFQGQYNIELLHESDILKDHERFKERGLKYLVERVYKIKRFDAT